MTTATIGQQQPPEQKRGVLGKILMVVIPIAVLLGFIALTIGIVQTFKQPEEKKRRFNTLAVTADYAKREDVQLIVGTQGEARPQTEIDLVPEVGGKVVYVSPNFVEGGIFRKGELLIRVDPSDYEVAVVQAQANLAQAQQLLIREQAEAEIAKQDYAELGRGEASPLALRQPQMAQASASVQAAEANLDGAKLRLTRTEVRAPFAGRVRTKASDLGQFVSPGTRLGRIFSTDIVEVRLPLTNDDLSKMDLPIAYIAKSRESAVPVKLSAEIGGKVQVWNGQIMRTDSTYDTQTRALFAIAEVFDPYGKGASQNDVPLAPGLFVDAEINGRKYENVVVIPRDGLRPEGEVYVVNDKGKVTIRDAVVIDTNANTAILSGGVESGELVVLSPMERSRTEMTLKVLDVNDPENVLVDPPEPEWMKKAREESDKTKKGRGKRGDQKDGDTSKDKDSDKTEADTKSADATTTDEG